MNNKIKTVIGSLIGTVALSATQAHAVAPSSPPIAKAGETWVLQTQRSDEFNTKDSSKWDWEPENFGVWSWRTANATVSGGKLSLTTRRQNHTRRFWDGCNRQQVDNFPLYYTSGIAKSKTRGTYGYYEASIKGANTYPGVSPAFWMYSPIDRTLTRNGDVQYSEIDVVELTQKNDVRLSDHDLHNIVVLNGQPTWQRPLQVHFNHNQVRQQFDPRAGFHTYGVNVTEDDITWYVDGVEIATKENRYWHREMNLTLSQGLRGSLVEFRCNQFYPGSNRPSAGYPTSMEVEYVRTWVKTGNSGNNNNNGNTGNNNNNGNTGNNNNNNGNTGNNNNNGNTGNNNNAGNNNSGNSCAVVNTLRVTPARKVLNRGEKVTLNSVILPRCASNKRVIFKSNNPSVAVVTGAGVVTARNSGSAVITATSKNGRKTDTVRITVR